MPDLQFLWRVRAPSRLAGRLAWHEARAFSDGTRCQVAPAPGSEAISALKERLPNIQKNGHPVSVALITQIVGWDGVEAALLKLKDGGETFEQFVVQQLQELESLRANLAERQQRLHEENQILLNNERELESRRQLLDEARQASEQSVEQVRIQTEQVAQAQAELTAAQARLAGDQQQFEAERAESHRAFEQRLREWEAARDAREAELQAAHAELNRLRQEGATSEAEANLLRRLGELEQQRAALEHELNESRGQIGQLSESAAELAKVRIDLAQAREELVRKPAGDGKAGEKLRQEVIELEKERAALEAELEAVRHRAVELAETAAAERQRVAEERAEWAGEIKQLRRMLERQAAAAAPGGRHDDAALRSTAPAGATVQSDPMLDSVMAQFDMLQRDIARRRSGGKRQPRQDVA